MSSGAAVPASARNYRMMSSGEMMVGSGQDATSRSSVSYSWQQQEYQPSTVVSVRVVGDLSPAATCTGSTSARRSSGQQEGDVYDRTGAISYYQMPSPAQFGSQPLRRLTSVSAVGRQNETAQHATEMPPPSRRMMMNTRVMAASSDRESVLQKFNEELHQQKQMSWKIDYPLSSLRTQTDILKPVPVKAQPSMQRFRPLMSSPSQVPSSTVVPSTAQISPGQSALSFIHSTPGRKTDSSSSFVSTEQSAPGLSPRNIQIDRLSLSCGADAGNRYLPAAGVSQFGSLVASAVSRWHPDPGTESMHSPGWQSSTLASDTQHMPAFPSRTGNPMQYSSQQHGVSSPLNYGSPMYPSLQPQSPQSLTSSHAVRSVNLVSPQHSSPQQHVGVQSPSMSYQPVYSEGSYHAVYSPSKSVSPSKLNQQSTFSPPCCCSAMSMTTVTATDRSASSHGSDVGVEVSLAASRLLSRSASTLRRFRIEAPATSVVPPRPSYPPQRHKLRQFSILPPESAPRHISRSPRSMFPRSNIVDAGSFRLRATAQRSQSNVRNSAAASRALPLSSMVSPGKFFTQGTMDFDSYIGRPIVVPQNQTVTKSETLASSAAAEAAKPSKKLSSPLCSGVKRKLQLTEPPAEVEMEPKVEHRFVDKFQESVSCQRLHGAAEGESPNKWPVVRVSEKQSKVLFCYFYTSFYNYDYSVLFFLRCFDAVGGPTKGVHLVKNTLSMLFFRGAGLD